MTQTIVFDPLVPWGVIWALAGLGAAGLVLAFWRGLRGWALRALALAVLGAALAGPALQSQQRRTQSDIVLALIDESESQSLAGRPAQTAAALANLRAELAAIDNTELREVVFSAPDDTAAPDDTGTAAMAALNRALAAEPSARIAGVFLLTDGLVHDAQNAPNLPAPFHVLQTGRSTDWDRRLIITDAPAFGILGEELRLGLRIEDEGTPPPGTARTADITIAADTDAPVTFTVPVGQDLQLPLRLPHAGANILQLSLPEMTGELTPRNNAAVVQINGVRDRLRVLLVSGQPHAGERMWRNLLKSDPSVDLVHFTILRPPEKQDGVPTQELALIAFPTRELFVEKINEFDLIIFDRFAQQGLLPSEYLENVVQYVRGGGTVLVSAGPEYGMVDSLWRSPLAQILPAQPTARVIEQGFRPALTDMGLRHPVTEGLASAAQNWGRWFRMIEITPLSGQVVMSGPDERPLLVLDRVGEGRIAVLASDHVWLWGRGFEGGGPQLDLLRRLAHWMLKEPELEEEALIASAQGNQITIQRRSLAPNPPSPLTITAPNGTQSQVTMTQQGPGRYSAQWTAPQLGLYRLAQDGLVRVVAVGTATPREFAQVLANAAALQPLVAQTRGGIWRIEEGTFDVRTAPMGRAAAGRGWLGITPRGAYITEGVRIAPLMPAYLWLGLAAALMLAAWLWEGRRRTPPRT